MIRLHLRNSTVAALADGIQALFGKVPVSETLMDVEAMLRVAYRKDLPWIVLHLTPEQCNALAAYCRPEPVRLAEFPAYTSARHSLSVAVGFLRSIEVQVPSEGTLELWHRPAGPFPDVARMLPSHCADLAPPAGQVPDFADNTLVSDLTDAQLVHLDHSLLQAFSVKISGFGYGSQHAVRWDLSHLENGASVELPYDATAWQAWKAAEKLDAMLAL